MNQFTNLNVFANIELLHLDVTKPIGLPFTQYLKDQDGKYLGCNDIMAQLVGFNVSDEVKGLTDLEIITEKDAKSLRENDRKVMETGKPEVYFERILVNNREIIFISQKAPLVSKMNKVIGITGVSLFQVNNDLISKYHLTNRQYDCLRYLIKGLTAKQIANEMLVSPRTVEHHIVAIKTKLDCKSRSEIMEKTQHLNLMTS